MTPAAYLRALARAHLLEEPQWSGGEPAALYAVAAQLRAIGNNVKGRGGGRGGGVGESRTPQARKISGGNLARFGVRAAGREPEQ